MTASVTVAGVPVLDGTLSWPWEGTWVAHVELPGSLDVNGQVTVGDGSTELTGTARTAGVVGKRTLARIVGGAGGLTKELEPKHYQGAKVRDVLGDACSDAGETMSQILIPDVALAQLDFWTRFRQTAGQAIKQLAESQDAVWRVLTNGTVWMGDPDSGAVAPQQARILNQEPYSNLFFSSPGGLWLQPGMAQDVGQVERVHYTLGDKLRAHFTVRT